MRSLLNRTRCACVICRSRGSVMAQLGRLRRPRRCPGAPLDGGRKSALFDDGRSAVRTVDATPGVALEDCCARVWLGRMDSAGERQGGG